MGASIPTLVAMELNKSYGLWGVGLYMAANGVTSMPALYLSRETRDLDMSDSATLAR